MKPFSIKNKNGLRAGLGFDAHDYSTSGTLVLGGVNFPGAPRLRGHSDGDALLHAIIDALLGAAGLGDIGEFFPDSKKSIKGISSRVMLKEVLRKVKRAGLQIVHVDTVVVAAKPKITPAKKRLRARLAADLGISAKNINVKAKTPEGTRILKKGGVATRGIAAWAMATLKYRG